MTKNPRGTCIIINNTPLDLHAPGMVGSELDVQRIEALFRQLHFQVTIKSNVSADPMITTKAKIRVQMLKRLQQRQGIPPMTTLQCHVNALP